jgi:hypothetical protein
MICKASFRREIVADHLIFRATLPSLSLYPSFKCCQVCEIFSRVLIDIEISYKHMKERKKGIVGLLVYISYSRSLREVDILLTDTYSPSLLIVSRLSIMLS